MLIVDAISELVRYLGFVLIVLISFVGFRLLFYLGLTQLKARCSHLVFRELAGLQDVEPLTTDPRPTA